MIKLRNILLIVGALLVGAGTFAATRAARVASSTRPETTNAATETLFNWLNVSADKRAELREHDPTFAADLNKLRAELAARRSDLAAALEGNDSSDELISARVEAVIAASGQLERRITRYLLTVRDHLSAEQRQKLFALCAEGVRAGPGWRWRGGGMSGAGMGGGGRGPGGPGGPGGFGPGRGRGGGGPGSRGAQ